MLNMAQGESGTPRIRFTSFFTRRSRNAINPVKDTPVSSPIPPSIPEVVEPHETEFKDTSAFRVLSHLGCLDLKADPTGKTVKESRRYIRATLPDGKGGVEVETVYRIDGITNTRVSMTYVQVDEGKKTVTHSDLGAVTHAFWDVRVFKVASKADFDKGLEV